MGTKIRIDGQWVDLENNNANSPDRLNGEWLSNVSTSNRSHGVSYTNNTGKLIYVSATVILYSQQTNFSVWGNQQHRDIAGGSVWGYVSNPDATSYSNFWYYYNNICRVRDNGTNAASILTLNVRFFVPPNCHYGIKTFDTNNNIMSSSLIGLLNWNEFEIKLAYPDNNFTSLDPNSNNFHRAAKASSTTINSSWSQFMKDYAVWHEPGNYAVLDSQTYYSTTYTINITKAGDYILEYAMDDAGYITFDGTTVAQTVYTSGGYLGDESADPPDSVAIQNVTVGSHTLVANIKNSSSYPGQTSSTWDASPAGIAWRLKPFGT